MEQSEEWRPVVGWEEHYEVSNLGRVRRIQTGRILVAQCSSRKSNYCVYLGAAGRRAGRAIGHLVADAFLDGPRKGMIVCHKDNNIVNNKLENLYWVKHEPSESTRAAAKARKRTQEERAQCRARLLKRLQDPDVYAKFYRARKVICVETGIVYPTAVAAAAAFGMPASDVYSSCNRGPSARYRKWSIKGEPVFHFRYYNPEDWRPKERIWKLVPVPGMEDKYEVSNLGEVRRTKDQRILKNSWDKGNRTMHVTFYVNKKVRGYRIAKLVADAFLPKQYGMDRIGHRDGDLRNDCVTNLFRTNKQDQWRSPMAKAHYAGGPKRCAVICIETNVFYKSITDAAKATNMARSAVAYSCKKQAANTVCFLRHENGGKPVYHFRYADQQ